ncbi:MAG: hypothetical protein AB7E80_01415 [Hyphomicrobiaceae bacterium]
MSTADGTGRGQGGDRLVDRLLAAFETRHATFTNKAMQFVAMPLLVWGGLAVLRALPVPDGMSAVPGLDWSIAAAMIGIIAALALSLRLGAGMAVFFAVLLLLVFVYQWREPLPLWQPGLVALGAGWLAWLVGRRTEGRPRVLTEIAIDLLTGPLWLVASVLRLLRIGY